MRIFLTSVIVSFFIISCTPLVKVELLDNSTREKPSKDVSIFTDKQSVPYSFKEIAIIYIDDYGEMGYSDKTLLGYAVEKAREIGADGIVLFGSETTKSSGVLIGNVIVSGNRKV